MPNAISLPIQDGSPPPWYTAGLHFRCTQCGNCCSGAPGYVWLTGDDMTRMAAFLGVPIDDFTRRHVRRVGNDYSVIEKTNHDCIFLHRAGDKATCSIYPVRPTQCRTWPFWNMNLKSPDAWSLASCRCPGMCDASAPVHPVGQIEHCRNHPESPSG